MQTLLSKSEVDELNTLHNLLKDLTQEEQQQLIVFMQGINFAKKIEQKETA